MILLIEQIEWWQRNGHFNFELYMNILKAKQCTHSPTFMVPVSKSSTTLTAKPSAIGRKNNSSQQAPICQEHSQFRNHESA
jgi:hypothetical protein